MKRTPRSLSQTASFVLAVAVVSVACGAPAHDTETEAGPETSNPTGDRYTVRGRVVELPDAGQAEARLRIQHEAIPDFKGMDGKVWEGGMESMTMIFAVAEGVSLEEISAGDKVEFVLVVNWEKKPTQSITEIVNLPAETELDFGPATEDTH
jgi:Cu/Ag efflux protein CusF